MTPACKFCRIVTGELDAVIVLEDECCVAFLDNRPLFPGHCLLVPKTHIETLPQLPDDLVRPFFSNARLLSSAVESAMEADGTFVAINNKVSQSVPHLHVHIVPRRRKDGLKGFFWPRNPYTDEEDARQTAARVKAAVDRLRSAGKA